MPFRGPDSKKFLAAPLREILRHHQWDPIRIYEPLQPKVLVRFRSFQVLRQEHPKVSSHREGQRHKFPTDLATYDYVIENPPSRTLGAKSGHFDGTLPRPNFTRARWLVGAWPSSHRPWFGQLPRLEVVFVGCWRFLLGMWDFGELAFSSWVCLEKWKTFLIKCTVLQNFLGHNFFQGQLFF